MGIPWKKKIIKEKMPTFLKQVSLEIYKAETQWHFKTRNIILNLYIIMFVINSQ